MNKKLAVFALALILSGCMGYAGDPYTMRAAADAALEATQAARSDRSAWATMSAAQTQSAVRVESERLQAYAIATQQAFEFEQVRAQATAQAAQTATAYPMTVTPLAATQAALQRKVEQDERRAFWSQYTDPLISILPTLLLFSALVLVLIGVARAFKRLLYVVEARGSAFQRGTHDSPVFLLRDERGHVTIIDPDRNFGAALTINGGKVESAGIAPTIELQERVTARDQLADLIGRLPQSRRSDIEDWLKRFVEMQALPATTQPNIEIVEPDSVSGWLAEVERKLLTDGEEGL